MKSKSQFEHFMVLVNNKWLMIFALLGLLTCQAFATEDEVSFGVGIGALNSGIGGNVGLMGENDFKYLAVGCTAIGYSTISGWIMPCGVGAGWIKTKLLSDIDNRHGFGLFIGPVGINNGNESRVLYGLGLTYVYFWKGLRAKGWNAGITPAIGKDSENTRGSLLINAGYQF